MIGEQRVLPFVIPIAATVVVTTATVITAATVVATATVVVTTTAVVTAATVVATATVKQIVDRVLDGVAKAGCAGAATTVVAAATVVVAGVTRITLTHIMTSVVEYTVNYRISSYVPRAFRVKKSLPQGKAFFMIF